ncbi:aminotransferase class I/II-fold pyridoxal phosphate-dependent enzyme [Flammeovirgaceae bacterium SG7u.111]|nr:aminotransferase class I/II-fold pyridoxal phosphate-dependent enzyme [Flammeovirgaceae bacterium SG7u.132]WPO35120.1 aminotransferase class I/II-fold pyridoxal phosphate-dependent enzyme [Flammeovirgaceae bacterium SG7u.111]
MLNPKEFRKTAHEFVDWMADYLENVEEYPVKSQSQPGDIFSQLPQSAPDKPEEMSEIMKDFQEVIMPGITHWQSPNFFAYFNANGSYPSLLAEMLTATLGTQCMIWETSPAAAELEEMMMNWLRDLTGLPSEWHGVIQDTASTATLTALLTAREKYSEFQVNENGFENFTDFRVYCSTETHSSVEKGVKIAGFGKANLVKIPVDEGLAMDAEALEKAIEEDLAAGKKPLCVVAALGTTGTTAFDPLEEIAQITQKHKIWLHVDAAYAGTAFVLPETRHYLKGVEHADSYVFNPHKWMFTHFDCSAYFVKDKDALLNTFSILPEYLRTETTGKVNDYRDWGIQLGRRFRALKLWFVMRNYGADKIREEIKFHLDLAEGLVGKIEAAPDFEMLTPLTLNLACFRFKPVGLEDEEKVNELNAQLVAAINKTGKIYLTHTKIRGKYTLRIVTGQTNITQKHVDNAWELLKEMARGMV